MISHIYEEKQDDFEVIERKGRGHPDTLADTLADTLSNKYSQYTLEHFGAILHHNFDKLNILGGKSFVAFGESHMVNPIRVVINGRATLNFGGEDIPVKKMLCEWTYEFFEEKFGDFISRDMIRIIYEVSTSSTAGAVHGELSERNHRHKWFAPDSLEDLPEVKELTCNDTSVGVYTPPSPLAKFVLDIEDIVHDGSSDVYGTDIKIMCVRHGQEVSITLALPMLAQKIASMDEFIKHKEIVRKKVTKKFECRFSEYNLELTINAGDNYESGDIYLTHLGSCCETGDEGLVGRGNRVGGLIQVSHPMSMEGACGKNPVYYTGKVLSAVAYEIGEELSKRIGTHMFTIYLVGQRRRSLKRPWKVCVQGPRELLEKHQDTIKNVCLETLDNVEQVTVKLIEGKIPLC